jgi:hypothetical protein
MNIPRGVEEYRIVWSCDVTEMEGTVPTDKVFVTFLLNAAQSSDVICLL